MNGKLSDLAEHVGVSEATVSRVLNERPGVASSTRQAVLTAVDVLGYERPSKLRRHAAGLIGLITPELTNPFFPLFAQTLETHLAAAGYTPVLCIQTPGGVHEDQYVEMLLARGVSGIIFVSGFHADSKSDISRYVELCEQGLPIVMINGWRAGVPSHFISHDDRTSMRLAVEHLRDLGHRRIGFATGPARYVPVQRRVEGFREAMRPLCSDAEIDDLVQTTLFSIEGGGTAGLALINAGVSAIVCGSDLMALGVVRTARQQGLEVPADLSVVGSDDFPLTGFTDPPLTTIRQDVVGMAEAAVTSIIEEIAGEKVEHREYLFAPELVLRRSTAPLKNLSLQG